MEMYNYYTKYYRKYKPQYFFIIIYLQLLYIRFLWLKYERKRAPYTSRYFQKERVRF